VYGPSPNTHVEGRISGLPTEEEKPPEGGEESKMRRLLLTLVVLSVFLLAFTASLRAASSAELAQGNNERT
jgi:hypothetical protein